LNGLPLYFATLVELGKKNDLYLLAHSLVDEYPKKAVTWFAIGCYYMATRQYDAARKYFSKATSIDASFVQAWIGYGHAFAAQDESDQAMAAYRTATRLFAGTHIPVMSIGMEYQRTNNLSLASQFFRKSFEICSTDPLLFNEYGVLLYRQGEYVSAVENFERALDLAPKPVTHRWESLVVNLAQALRKMGRHDEAIEQFQYALSVAPRNASTHAALAFTYQVKSRCTEPVSLGLAIEHYHKALSLRSDDAFSQHHLELALIDQSAITVPKHEKVDFETAFPIGDPIAATPEAPSPQGGLFPPPSPRSFRSTPTFGQTPFASAAVDESVDMDQSVDMDEGE
jgi:anaphase-promoting complex subunit 6